MCEHEYDGPLKEDLKVRAGKHLEYQDHEVVPHSWWMKHVDIKALAMTLKRVIKVVGKSTGKVHVFTPATKDSVNNDISHHVFADDDLVLLFDEPSKHYTLARKVERSGRKRSTKRQSYDEDADDDAFLRATTYTAGLEPSPSAAPARRAKIAKTSKTVAQEQQRSERSGEACSSAAAAGAPPATADERPSRSCAAPRRS